MDGCRYGMGANGLLQPWVPKGYCGLGCQRAIAALGAKGILVADANFLPWMQNFGSGCTGCKVCYVAGQNANLKLRMQSSIYMVAGFCTLTKLRMQSLGLYGWHSQLFQTRSQGDLKVFCGINWAPNPQTGSKNNVVWSPDRLVSGSAQCPLYTF